MQGILQAADDDGDWVLNDEEYMLGLGNYSGG